jgi:hypothetical protein
MRTPMTHTRRSSLLFLAALTLASCSLGQDASLAKAQIPHFREQMAAQQFNQIYAEAADELKSKTSEQDFVTLFAAFERKLGGVKSAEENGWKVNYSTSGNFATLSYKTQFEKGAGVETFVYRLSGDRALLAGYNVNSPALVIN